MKLSELARKIAQSFNISELRDLCFSLDIEYENLSGDSRKDKVIALIDYCKRHHKLEDLIDICESIRPRETWQFYEFWYLDNSVQQQSSNLLDSLTNRLLIFGFVIATSLIIGLIFLSPFTSRPETNQVSQDSINVEGDANNSVVIIGDGAHVSQSNLQQEQKIFPIIDLCLPIEHQLQLFPTDKIIIWGNSDEIESIYLGRTWELYSPDREYIVWGIEGNPITPEFRVANCPVSVKTEITITKDTSEPRDLR